MASVGVKGLNSKKATRSDVRRTENTHLCPTQTS